MSDVPPLRADEEVFKGEERRGPGGVVGRNGELHVGTASSTTSLHPMLLEDTVQCTTQ
jgi:hypothetical protein